MFSFGKTIKMSQFKSVERLSHLLRYLNEQHYPSMSDILQYLTDKDLFPTERTVQRDLKTLRELCFIDVQYNRLNNGYFIDHESQADFTNWMQVFELFHTARILNETLVKSASNIDFIDFDRSSFELKDGILGKLLEAVVERNKISFDYQNFLENTPKTISLYPHLLKQYQNRWYIFGCFPNGDFKSFGLERITNLKVLTESFKAKMKHPKDAFNDVVGLIYSQSTIENVVLSYTKDQSKYIKTQPIHSSQKVLLEDENEFRIQIRVRPNYELQEQILKQGERVKVIEPEWLKEEVKERLRDALNQY
jgi:predicted DNA-binding transcriptional regulator YafY